MTIPFRFNDQERAVLKAAASRWPTGLFGTRDNARVQPDDLVCRDCDGTITMAEYIEGHCLQCARARS
ncbi:hypothetical protein [Rhizobium sp. RU36D]|uniref:hypothetical protein n=1 Tax=Rhizobium sp. RU36D TaxID=1907415 RepID=UPI0009D82BED|nr:hypothetical protein [Rhizobium sp. RU36D]SMD18578.1 hypothetical protein SAMN05880593_13537 [Rhizobium sp. RU36D]